MNKKNLKIRPVTGEDVEQYNALLRYVFQVTDQQLRSVGWKEKEFIQAKFPTLEKADVIGWFDGDDLVCSGSGLSHESKDFRKDIQDGRTDRSRHISRIFQYGADA